MSTTESGRVGEGVDFADVDLGVYVHLPWCERVCPYCDFAVIAARPLDPADEAAYLDDLSRELAARAPAFRGLDLATIYLGGGTPALFGPASIDRLLRAIRAAFPRADGTRATPIETTLELNPSTLERARLPAFREAGVDRLSVGVQSFDDGLLRRLGRAHRADVARATLEATRAAGFDEVSLDLIFAGPGQTLADLDRDLDAVLDFGPEHVSTYELTWEPDTPFGRALAAGQLAAPDEALAADMIEQVEARLRTGGYDRYEISSYARSGHAARHNARYWRRAAVLGLGLGAHSTEPRSRARPHGARRANPRTLEAWRSALYSDAAKAGEEDVPSAAVARGEAVFLALRERKGLDAGRFAAEFGAPPGAFFAAEIERSKAAGWLEESGAGDLRLTSAGRMVADSVAEAFVAVD